MNEAADIAATNCNVGVSKGWLQRNVYDKKSLAATAQGIIPNLCMNCPIPINHLRPKHDNRNMSCSGGDSDLKKQRHRVL
jgi:hypothetical protein